jgi:LuxR family maltose regulon positive regulatory protein
MEAKGILARMDEENIRFTREEMLEYFNEQGISVTPLTADAIYKDTEGWIFALYLAGRSIQNSGDVNYIPQAMHDNIFKLIEKEIVSTVSPGLRKFLICLTLVEHLHSDMLLEIGTAKIIAEMESLGSYITKDIYANTYHIHPLLVEYLRGMQAEISEDEKKEIYLKAARWCLANNQKVAAINYSVLAGDYEELFRIIYTLPMLLPRDTATMLLEIMNNIPESIYHENTVSYIVRTRLFIILGMLDEAELELKTIIKKLEAEVSKTASPSASINVNMARTLQGCWNNLGFLCFIRANISGDYSFTEFFKKAYDYFLICKYTPIPPISVLNIGTFICRVNSIEKGEMEKFTEALALAVPYMASSMGGCAWGFNELAVAELAIYRGELNAAEEWSIKAVKKAREKDQYEIENRALFFLLRIALARGSETEEIIKQMEAQLDKPNYVNRSAFHDIIMGWYYIQTGSFQRVALWLKNNFEESDLNSHVQGLETLIKVRYHIAAGEYSAAMAAIQIQARLGDFVLGRIGLKVLEAVCRYKNGDKAESFTVLKEAWDMAEPNGFMMPFTEQGKDMRTLVSAALENGKTGMKQKALEQIRLSASAYAKKLAIIQRHLGTAKSHAGLADELSKRELEVLINMSQGLTGEEIAQDTGLSFNTVKSIIKRIYCKLGALNRVDALRIAGELGLLEGYSA